MKWQAHGALGVARAPSPNEHPPPFVRSTMNKLILTLLGALLLASLPPSPVAAEEQDAAALLAKGVENLKVESAEFVVRLERHRRDVITVFRLKAATSDRDPTVSKSWVLRLEPEAVAGIQLLVLTPTGGKPTIKQYLSATGAIINIIAPPGTQSLFGTHFRLRDLSALEDTAGTHKVVSEDKIAIAGAEHAVVVIETILQDGPYSKLLRFLDSETLLPLRIDYFDKAGTAVKRLKVLALADSAPVATHTRMELLGMTPVEYTDMFVEEYRVNLDQTELRERTFTEDYMKEVGETYR